VFAQLSERAGPGDQITARFWGLAGGSINLWFVAMNALAVLFALPYALGLSWLYGPDFAVAGVGAVLNVWYLTRPALVIAVTEQRQLLACRVSRPFARKTFAQAPVEAARLGDFRRGWLYSRLRYCGPGTDGREVWLNVPAGCRLAAQALARPERPLPA
jgi:hypothetical protein